ncbi:hypothetical protein BX600DRAFT_491074 [Xylariales sp. PMI_506]|nr:hypothetical protein BX600DRAFT_491074 [Xylariales sp. PMI_506]
MASTSDVSTTERALLLPEILSLVFHWILQDKGFSQPVYGDGPDPNREADLRSMLGLGPDDELALDDEDQEPELLYSYGASGVLIRCGMVNSLWYSVAMPHAWKSVGRFPISPENTMESIFGRIDPSRRQYHANLVVEACMAGVAEGAAADKADANLEGVEFPNLKQVELRLVGFHESMHIPILGKSGVTVLKLNPYFESNPDTWGVCQKEMGKILEQIPSVFPDVEDLSVVDQCLAYPGALERCASRLTNLKVFNHCLVKVTAEEIGYPF